MISQFRDAGDIGSVTGHMSALERVLQVIECCIDVVVSVAPVSERLRLGTLQIHLQLKGGEHEHLLFRAVDLFIQQLPFRLLVNLVDSHGVVFRVQIVERVKFEA